MSAAVSHTVTVFVANFATFLEAQLAPDDAFHVLFRLLKNGRLRSSALNHLDGLLLWQGGGLLYRGSFVLRAAAARPQKVLLQLWKWWRYMIQLLLLRCEV